MTNKQKSDAAIAFAMQTMERMPKDKETLEHYLTALLIVYWSALWGSFGTQFAREFISAQLASMESEEGVELYVLNPRN